VDASLWTSPLEMKVKFGKLPPTGEATIEFFSLAWRGPTSCFLLTVGSAARMKIISPGQ